MNYRNNEPRKLFRSRRDRVICGVCGGIAEYYDFSPWGVRLLFIAASLLGVTIPLTLLIYIVMAVTIRPAPEPSILSGEYADGEQISSRAEALRRIHRRYELIEKRIERMESIVTSPGFGVDDELRRL